MNTDKYDYKKLRPFCRFVLENFPFIEYDFDALTPWKMWCALGNEINKIINSQNQVGEEVENLSIAFNNLQDYINNYFENLDVQDEVNNKLDEMVENGTFQALLNTDVLEKKPFYFNTLAIMKASNILSNGDLVFTKGYYSPNDGGDSKYLVREKTNEDVTNDGNLVQLNDSDLVAELIFENEINVAQFGAIGDDNTDDTQAIKNAINFLKNGMSLNFIHNKIYQISETLEFPKNSIINFNGAYLRSNNDFTENDFLINYGSKESSQTVITATRNYGIYNLNMINYTNKIINGIYVTKECEIKNIYSYGLNKTVDITTSYIDKVTIDNVEMWAKLGSDYAINTGAIGDGRVVKNIHLYSPQSDNYAKTLQVGFGHNCCEVSTIINGDIYLNGTSNVNMKDLHLEQGSIHIKNAIANISNVYMWKQPGIVPLIVEGDNSIVDFSDILITYQSRKDYSNDTFIDLNITNRPVINMKNCYKSMIDTDNIDKRYYVGLNSNSNDFNNNKLLNSICSSNNNNLNIKSLHDITIRGGSAYETIANIYTDGAFDWKEATGTYYYNIIQLFDKNRMIGYNYNTNEKSKSLTYNGDSALISINGRFNSDIRLYRGTTSHEYDKYCDIGLKGSQIFDNGLMANAEKFLDRVAGDIDTFYSARNVKKFDGDIVEVITDNANSPSIGTWKKGDIVISTTGSKWICKVAGTPGTWQSL